MMDREGLPPDDASVDSLEREFMQAFMHVYDGSPPLNHDDPSIREALAVRSDRVHRAIDLGLALFLFVPNDGSLQFNLALLLNDIGNVEGSVIGFMDAVRLMKRDDPDRDESLERLNRVLEKAGYDRAAAYLHRFDIARRGDGGDADGCGLRR